MNIAKKLLFPALLSLLVTFSINAQKSKVFSAFQLIESGKYEDAKEVIEEALKDKSTKNWYRAWHAKGLLCQTAYEEGIKKDDKDKYQLYPDQLFMAYQSYMKAIELDKRGRLSGPLAPNMVRLANSFQSKGEELFKQGAYNKASHAFQNAITISKDPLLSVKTDPNLIYNAAIAAVKSKDSELAVTLLEGLNEDKYSPNISHLLFTVYMEAGDTLQAKTILLDGIERYEENEDLVLILTDLYLNSNETDAADKLLVSAMENNPKNAVFPYTRGLVLQKIKNFEEAIASYQKAIELDPDNVRAYTNIGNSYYNMGVNINENARQISSISLYRKEKEKASQHFTSAVEWFEKAHNRNPEDEKIISRLQELYLFLGMREKAEKMEKKN